MQSRSQKTRSEIKSAAIERFCDYGYDAASVADICAQAGVSKGAFYHHFPSKQSLFLAIMEDWLQELDSQLFDRGKQDTTTPQMIREMGSTLGVVFKTASGQLPMFMEFLVQASRDNNVWKAVIAPYRKYQQSFARLIEKGKNEGSLSAKVDSEGTAWILISLAVGILLQGVLDPEAADWNKVTNDGVQMLLNSIRRGEP